MENRYLSASHSLLTERRNITSVFSSNQRRWGEIYLSHTCFEKELKKRVSAFLVEESVLFLSIHVMELDILTEPITTMKEMEDVVRICDSLGYRVLQIRESTEQGDYLGSSGGGHYSRDFYEVTRFSRVTIVSK
jgi:hypothetical protein